MVVLGPLTPGTLVLHGDRYAGKVIIGKQGRPAQQGLDSKGFTDQRATSSIVRGCEARCIPRLHSFACACAPDTHYHQAAPFSFPPKFSLPFCLSPPSAAPRIAVLPTPSLPDGLRLNPPPLAFGHLLLSSPTDLAFVTRPVSSSISTRRRHRPRCSMEDDQNAIGTMAKIKREDGDANGAQSDAEQGAAVLTPSTRDGPDHSPADASLEDV